MTAQSDNRPLDAAYLARRLAALGISLRGRDVALAVSGGADSMALALLFSQMASRAGRAKGVTALTVDHGLRPEAAEEASRVGAWCRALGLGHAVLGAGERPPRSNIQAWARQARYTAMRNWCRERGIDLLFLAHHRDDQAETFLINLGRGSGVDGLAAMPAVSQFGGIRLVRPFLDVPKSRLIATLRGAGHDWIEDPSNDSDSYLRNRLRALMPRLAEEGIDAARLHETAANLARAREALETATDRALASAACAEPEGYLRLDYRTLAAEPDEIVYRALRRLLASAGDDPYPPRFQALQRLKTALDKDAGFTARTLAGCRIMRCPKRWARWPGEFLVLREAAAAGPDLMLHDGLTAVWDGRFRVSVRKALPAAGLRVGMLGRDGVRRMRRDGFCFSESGVPGAVRPVLPSIRCDDRLVSVPLLGYVAPQNSYHGDEVTMEFVALDATKRAEEGPRPS